MSSGLIISAICIVALLTAEKRAAQSVRPAQTLLYWGAMGCAAAGAVVVAFVK